MNDSFKSIYEAMLGVTSKPNPPFPVDDEFAADMPCDKLYEEIYALKMKLNNRLNQDEDSDLEAVCDNFWDIMEILCEKMYQYGMKAGQTNCRANEMHLS